MDLYLAEFTENLQWYIDNLGYAKSTSIENGPGGMNGAPTGDLPEGAMADGNGPPNVTGALGEVGTPDAGTSQSATGGVDSANYETYEEMLTAYKADIEEIEKGDKYGNNIVELYNPLKYIGAKETEDPSWTKIIMGASEGDMSMFSSLNLQLAWLNAGVDTTLEWQWDGGHVPSEVLGDSFSLTVDQMYGEHVDGAVSIKKAKAETQTENGSETEATGTDISSWVNYDDTSNVSFSLADAATYRTVGASKAVPGFDVIDYGQEDYVFGSSEKDARHWNRSLLDIFEKNSEELSALFNKDG